MRFQSLIAEFVGTFALIFVGVLSVAFTTPFAATVDPHGNLLTVALAHGFTIAVMVSATAAISGGHLNPAVSIGLWLAKRISTVHVIGYILVQLMGAVLGAYLARYAVGLDVMGRINFGAPSLASSSIVFQQGFLLEAVLTFFLMFVIFGTAVDKRAPKIGGLYIGLTITLDILIAGPLTGAAMNPARWFGPTMFWQDWSGWALYVFGPITGAAVAALLWRFVLEERDAVPVVPEPERVA